MQSWEKGMLRSPHLLPTVPIRVIAMWSPIIPLEFRWNPSRSSSSSSRKRWRRSRGCWRQRSSQRAPLCRGPGPLYWPTCASTRPWLSVLMSVIEPIFTDVCPTTSFLFLFSPTLCWHCREDSAGQSDITDWGFTLWVSGSFGLEQIEFHSFISPMQLCEGSVGWGQQAAIHIYPPKHCFNISSWMLRASVFQVLRPKTRACRQTLQGLCSKEFISAPLFSLTRFLCYCSSVSSVCWDLTLCLSCLLEQIRNHGTRCLLQPDCEQMSQENTFFLFNIKPSSEVKYVTVRGGVVTGCRRQAWVHTLCVC